MRPLLRRHNPRENAGQARYLEQGYHEVLLESIRFWRVCIDYGVGIQMFSDCYASLCFWLLPVSKEELSTGGKDVHFLLARESYFLLEHLSRTLPVLHVSDEQMDEVDGMTWSWSVGQPMLDPAMKWLSTESCSQIHMLLEECILVQEKQSLDRVSFTTNTKMVLGILAAVLHFVATICERIVSEKHLRIAQEDPEKFALPWLPTFLPQLGLVLAGSGLLTYSESDLELELDASMSQEEGQSSVEAVSLNSAVVSNSGRHSPALKKFTFVEFLNLCHTRGDKIASLASTSCLHALVRVSSIVDSLIYIAKPNASASVEEQSLAHRVLEHGLLLSAEAELRDLLLRCKENVITGTDMLQLSVRGGPAPGVGVGWGSLCGGAWSKEVMIVQSNARLALDLLSIFSSKVWLFGLKSDGDVMIEEFKDWGLSSRVNFCLSVISESTTVNSELVRRAASSIIFHPSLLSVLMQNVQEALAKWRSKRAEEESFQVKSHGEANETFDEVQLSSILLTHLESFWLASKKKKGKTELATKGLSKKRGTGIGSMLATVEEEGNTIMKSLPESLMIEWVGQRLPLPSHWFLSPICWIPRKSRSILLLRPAKRLQSSRKSSKLV
jgi:hypothetical protein